MAKVDLTHVPYRGASPAYTDVIAGRVDCTFAVMASGLPLVQGGQLRALGVTTGARVAAAPDIPTIAEAGVPGYDTSSWFAFFVPAKTPDDIVRKMHADTVAVLGEPPIRAKLDQLGVVIVGPTPDELGTHLRAEMEKWGPMIKAANIRVNEGSAVAGRSGSPPPRHRPPPAGHSPKLLPRPPRIGRTGSCA